MLVAVAICAVWLASIANRAHRQRALVHRVRQLGGMVAYDYQIKRGKGGRYLYDPVAISPSAGWLVDVVGVDYFNSIVLVSLRGSQVTDGDMILIGDVPTVENVDLTRTGITSDGLRHLNRLTNLQLLGLWHTRVDDRGLEYLACHRHMQSLVLDDTDVTDQGLAFLEGMTELQEWLGLSNTAVSDEGLKHLENFKHLRQLNLQGTRVTAAGAKRLKTALPETSIGTR